MGCRNHYLSQGCGAGVGMDLEVEMERTVQCMNNYM